MIPGLLQQRLLHSKLQAEEATASLNKTSEIPSWLGAEKQLMNYSVQYPSQQRKLTIYFNEHFPYHIAGWEETYPDGFGKNKQTLTTRAVKDKALIIDYWNHNKNIDTVLRDSLGVN